MFQKILVVLDRCNCDPQVIQTAFTLAQLDCAKLALLHIVTLPDTAPILLLSELDRQKNWAGTDFTVRNAWSDRDPIPTAPAKLIRPKHKLKVAANVATLEPPVFNHLRNSSDHIPTEKAPSSTIPNQSRSLGNEIGDVAQLCKADLIVLGLWSNASTDLAHAVIQTAHCPVLIVSACVKSEES